MTEYEEFVEKFKPKKTTDDCYTPDYIFNAVRDWACAEYDIDPASIVRPFWPGGDYKAFEYPEGCVVLDNPPFSCISEICRWYTERGISFFMFAPHLTNFSIRNGNHVIVGVDVTYENGARVNTSFITSLGTAFIRSAPGLYSALKAAQAKHREDVKPTKPKYIYPAELLTVSQLERISRGGVDFAVSRRQCSRISRLESQKPHKKTIFGSGYLLSVAKAAEKEAAEKEAAERDEVIEWGLSDEERQLVNSLDTEIEQRGHKNEHNL